LEDQILKLQIYFNQKIHFFYHHFIIKIKITLKIMVPRKAIMN